MGSIEFPPLWLNGLKQEVGGVTTNSSSISHALETGTSYTPHPQGLVSFAPAPSPSLASSASLPSHGHSGPPPGLPPLGSLHWQDLCTGSFFLPSLGSLNGSLLLGLHFASSDHTFQNKTTSVFSLRYLVYFLHNELPFFFPLLKKNCPFPPVKCQLPAGRTLVHPDVLGLEMHSGVDGGQQLGKSARPGLVGAAHPHSSWTLAACASNPGPGAKRPDL